MVGLKKALTGKNIASGWMYFYIHFAMEVLCFFCVRKQMGNSAFFWLFPFAYDILAFVPQSVIGYLNDRFPKFNAGLTGTVLMIIASVMFAAGGFPRYFVLVILCAGNALTHVGGAEVTIRSSNGRLSHPAVFVSGGAFGVITGTMLAKTDMPYWPVILFMISAIPFTLIAQKYRNAGESAQELCKAFNYAKKGVPASVILLVSFIIVALRSYMGYCLPMEWKTTSLHSVLLYVAMGTGKAVGGILADAYGVKRIALLSSILSLPFILLGNKIMLVSLIGIMLFSMTMSITLALNVSVLKSAPGLAFGYTTAALTFGVIPIFFVKISSYAINSVIVSALTVICIAAMLATIGKDEKINE
jgi:hypothetical protein